MTQRNIRLCTMWACPAASKMIDSVLNAVSRSAATRLTAAFDAHVMNCVECQQAQTDLMEPD